LGLAVLMLDSLSQIFSKKNSMGHRKAGFCCSRVRRSSKADENHYVGRLSVRSRLPTVESFKHSGAVGLFSTRVQMRLTNPSRPPASAPKIYV
jgi:hypothetical protein